jgi:hypothetical protein
MLARLIYVSEATDALNLQAVDGILLQARQKNRLRDVSGMLLFDCKAFLQVIEWDPQRLTDLYGRIAQDTRHRRLKLLEFTEVAERRFGAWAMDFAGSGSSNREVFLRYSRSSSFEPYELAASNALAILSALASNRVETTAPPAAALEAALQAG